MVFGVLRIFCLFILTLSFLSLPSQVAFAEDSSPPALKDADNTNANNPGEATAPKQETPTVPAGGIADYDYHDLIPSVYFKPVIKIVPDACDDKELVSMLSPEGKELEKMCLKDFKRCLMEGSCFVVRENSLKSYNYHSCVDSRSRFVEDDLGQCPYGYGVYRSCLDPYFTVAADRRYYKSGDVIFVPKLVGIELPGGAIHDGFFIVRDIGNKIKGPRRFDFYTGIYTHLSEKNTIAKEGFADYSNRFRFRRATQQESEQVLHLRNYPGLTKEVLEGAKDIDLDGVSFGGLF
ncbi:MAG: 3D domain-containing protein [Bacillota bacterium]